MRLTEEEKIILKNTDKKWRYIARDLCGDKLTLYENKPKKTNRVWSGHPYVFFYLPSFMNSNYFTFQSVQWADDEPLEFRNEKGEFLL